MNCTKNCTGLKLETELLDNELQNFNSSYFINKTGKYRNFLGSIFNIILSVNSEVSATDLWRGPKYATDFYIVSKEKLRQKLLKLSI